MQFLRLCIVRLENPPVEILEPWQLQMGAIEVQVSDSQFYNKEDCSLKVIVIASVRLENYPELSSSNRLTIPDHYLKSCEEAIEVAANSVSVSCKSPRTIASCNPFYAFSCDEAKELQWLEQADGLQMGIPRIIAFGEITIVPTLDLIRATTDRSDGVTLLAEALCQSHPMGKFREFMRFFERAFDRPVTQLEKKLFQFLRGFNAGYSRNEVSSWFALRNSSIHAKRGEFAVESSVQPYIRRIEQAAYDVLYNKAIWNDASQKRRACFQPVAWTQSEEEIPIAVISGGKTKIGAGVYDGFLSYPMDYQVTIEMPKNWWSK